MFDGRESKMKKEKAVLAAGCFWGVEELLRTYKGIINTEVGYSGGKESEASYKIVKTGSTEHAEALLIEFDADLISYKELLEAFFKLHDPTTKNQQGNDIGRQYRSAIFYFNDEQKAVANEVKTTVDQSGKWKKPVVTEIVPFESFFNAEDYHQDYLQKNPNGYTCHYWRD
jgi:methionine-S-sulfoxide reductase